MIKLAKFSIASRLALAVGGVALALGSPLLAGDRDPAYAAARAAGQIGEQVDGYLGIVGASTPDLRRMVEDLNIKRKAVYARKAREQHATIEDYAFTSGCLLIAQTVAGEKYQAPDGSWKTRTSAPPMRDPRCP
jgi:uncharacterized protein YdbL (DUF1318 family)